MARSDDGGLAASTGLISSAGAAQDDGGVIDAEDEFETEPSRELPLTNGEHATIRVCFPTMVSGNEPATSTTEKNSLRESWLIQPAGSVWPRPGEEGDPNDPPFWVEPFEDEPEPSLYQYVHMVSFITVSASYADENTPVFSDVSIENIGGPACIGVDDQFSGDLTPGAHTFFTVLKLDPSADPTNHVGSFSLYLNLPDGSPLEGTARRSLSVRQPGMRVSVNRHSYAATTYDSSLDHGRWFEGMTGLGRVFSQPAGGPNAFRADESATLPLHASFRQTQTDLIGDEVFYGVDYSRIRDAERSRGPIEEMNNLYMVSGAGLLRGEMPNGDPIAVSGPMVTIAPEPGR